MTDAEISANAALPGQHELSMTVLMTPDMANFSGKVHGGAILKNSMKSLLPAPAAIRATMW